MKRAFDLGAALAGIVVFAPLLLIIGIAVVLDSRGPAVFRQARVGRGGRLFDIYKFRTMVVDAEQLGGQLTTAADCRITRCGKLLRATKLDELPQLINVVKGDMSFVGPRPEVPKYVALYTEVQRRVLDLTPGITDPASIRYRNESALLAHASDPERTYVEFIMPEKIRLNLEYAAKANLVRDVGMVLRTLLSIARE